MKKIIIKKSNFVFLKKSWARVLSLLVFTFIFFTACQKEANNDLSSSVANNSNKTFLKSSLPDPYVKGEDIPEILKSIDESLKGGELEERNGNQLPFKFLGYDKTRAFKVYNDSFEITSYAFLAYTDITDLNKVVNIVVTQKKNGKPGKPYLYEYTFIKHPHRIPMHLATIVKYKINGVKVDIPGNNFNPCIDVICDQYNNPIGGGGTSGSGGSSGGGTGGTGGTSGTGGTGGYISCQTFIDDVLIGPSSYMQVKTTYCSDGTISTTIKYHNGYAFTDCCDSENVSIGVVYSRLNSSVSNYLSTNYLLQSSVLVFLKDQNHNVDAYDHVNALVTNMMIDAEYEQLVMSSFNFTPIMWQIGKELIIDKAFDIVGNIIGRKDLADAINALQASDWVSFSYNLGQLIIKNTPVGKALKILEAGSDMYKFSKSVEKVHSQIKNWTTTKTTQIWNIVKKNIKIASNPDYWKYVDNLTTAKFGPSFASFNNYAQKFKDKWGINQGEIWVHHAVERQAMTIRYPNLGLTEIELNSLENLRGIPASINNEIHLSAIRSRWNQFYSNNPPSSITKQKLLDQAKNIDNEFGHLFNPPIR